MTDTFVSNSANALPYLPNIAAAVSAPGANISPENAETKQKQAKESSDTPAGSAADSQLNDNDLVPGFGVERARELIMWLINLELRLPPYTEVSHA